MKICFEGPSGIGKTILSKLLDKEFKRIPEVNELFKNDKNVGGYWYYKMQVKRYHLSKSFTHSIFDGDIFQPLWYNWTYGYPNQYIQLNHVLEFYYKEILSGNIQFPDLYIVFTTSLENLKSRKEGDTTRKRSNFDKHLKLLTTQPLYFGYMKQEFPHLVQFLEYNSVEKIESKVRSTILARDITITYSSETILKKMGEWLSQRTLA